MIINIVSFIIIDGEIVKEWKKVNNPQDGILHGLVFYTVIIAHKFKLCLNDFDIQSIMYI